VKLVPPLPFVARQEAGFAGGLGETVPGADVEAFVAAVDPVADKRAQIFRNGALELNGQVGDAAAGVELVGRGDRPGRAGRDAAHARSAVVPLRRVGLEFQRGDDFAQEQPRTSLVWMSMVFCPASRVRPAAPAAFPGLGRYRRRPGLRAGLADFRRKHLELFEQDVVVILAQRVTGDASLRFGCGCQ